MGSARTAVAHAILASVPSDRGLRSLDALLAADAALTELAATDETLEQLRADRDRLQSIVDAIVDDDVELTLRKLEIGDRSINGALGAPHWAMRLLCASLAESLDRPDAPNYLEQHIEVQLRADVERQPFIITVQRPGGASPHQLRTRAETACRTALDYLANGAVFVAGDVETFDGLSRAEVMRILRDALSVTA